MECKRHKNVDEGDSSRTLYCLLSSSVKVSKRTIGIILEQVRPLCQIFLSIGVCYYVPSLNIYGCGS
jgi:uncharacterized integral membrane protein